MSNPLVKYFSSLILIFLPIFILYLLYRNPSFSSLPYYSKVPIIIIGALLMFYIVQKLKKLYPLLNPTSFPEKN